MSRHGSRSYTRQFREQAMDLLRVQGRAPTVAARDLGLPFSTYRRHLTQGMDRVVAWLWDQEIYGEHH